MECRHGRPECECAEGFFIKKSKEYEIKMSENWCREGCCQPIPQGRSERDYAVAQNIVTPAQNPIPTVLDHLAKAIEGLELAIGELDHRLQVVSSQMESPAISGYAIGQDRPGTSDTVYRISGYAETVNGLEARVQRMTRELEI